jgi:hypothetical protein
VRADAVLDQLRRQEPVQTERAPGKDEVPPEKPPLEIGSKKPRRFYGSVEIDGGRPVKAFDAILNAVVMELLRTNGASVKLTLEDRGRVAEPLRRLGNWHRAWPKPGSKKPA